MIEEAYAIVHSVCDEFAGDPRLSVFEVEVIDDDGTLVLYGATSEVAAIEELHRRLAELAARVELRDEVVRLPVREDGFLAHGVVRSSMAPMLAGPMISESPVSQVVFGQRLIVLQEYRRWLQSRTVDGYIGWIHRGYVHRMDETDARSWELGARGPLHMSLGAEIVDADGNTSHRIPWGGRVGFKDGIGFLPDGTSGFLHGEVVPMAELSRHFPPVGDSVVANALEWVGVPYVWGGITPVGADCSGLVQALYRAHGFELPRDSDLQAKAGSGLEPGDDFEALLPGDLLFFAEDGDRITHVAISEGGPKIVHSALGNGGVRRNDLVGSRELERELRSLFVCARRIIPREPQPTDRSEVGAVRSAD